MSCRTCMNSYQLYEKSSFAVELGAGIHLTPNGNGILRRWGIFAEEFGGTLLNRRFEFHYNGELILDENLATPNLRWEHPWHLVHRVALHERLKRAATGEDGRGWDKTGSLEQVLEVFKSFDPVLLRLFRKMDPKELKVWQLLDMEKPPAWVNERMALLGDAAHPFTPYQGQGANQAIEDAATIMVVLPYGTCPADVPERLKMYEKIRYDRAHKIQSDSRKAGSDWKDGKPQVDRKSAIFGSFNFAHDAYHHANIVFKRHLWKSTPGARWRMPVSFGPSYELRSHDSSDSRQTFTTAAVRFKSSRTYLESLLPTESYTFVADDTLCEVSLAITTRKNVPCLGGADYSRFGLYLHGVQYKRDDGSTVQGSFVPVLLEDSADMVISTREEQGMPALFCDIEVTSSPQTYQMKASWRGVNFTDLILEDLEEDPRAAETAGDDVSGRVLLSHHLRPKIGVPEEPGETCAIKGSIGDASCRVTQRWRIKKGSVKLQGHSWESLPTLHHVAASLADMAMYGIVSAEVVSGTGVPDKRKYSRI
ncbi:hypothetical protein NW754_006428 [Fusarium falciforme]|nr:hypothetical protein NW754_006428 [Fusarium falciforme]